MNTKCKEYFSAIFRFMLIPVICLMTVISILQEIVLVISGTSADIKFKTFQHESDSQTFPWLYCREEPVLFQTGTIRFGEEERQIDND